MRISDEIFARIQKDYDNGITQEQIAHKYNVDQQRINRVLSGKRKVSGFTIATLEKMFPHAVIYLDGVPPAKTQNEDQSVSINDNSGIANGIVKGNVTIQNGSSSGIPTDLRDAILSDASMTAKDKAALLRELMK